MSVYHCACILVSDSAPVSSWHEVHLRLETLDGSCRLSVQASESPAVEDGGEDTKFFVLLGY